MPVKAPITAELESSNCTRNSSCAITTGPTSLGNPPARTVSHIDHGDEWSRFEVTCGGTRPAWSLRVQHNCQPLAHADADCGEAPASAACVQLPR